MTQKGFLRRLGWIVAFSVGMMIMLLTALPASAQEFVWEQTGLYGGHIKALLVTAEKSLYAGTEGGVFRSDNRGNNWTAANTGLNLFVNSLSVMDTTLYTGTAGGVYRSDNRGNSWVNIGLENRLVQSLAVFDTTLYVGCGFYSNLPEGGGVYRSNDKGSTWTAVNTGLTNTDVKSLSVMGTALYAGTRGGVYRSNDKGSTWTAVNTGLTNTDVNSLSVMGATLFAGTSGGVYRSDDRGNNWTAVNTGLTNTWVNSLAVMGATLFAGTARGVYRFDDGGSSWVKTGLTNVVISFAVMGTTLFAGAEDGVYRSDDRGNNWTAVNTGLTSIYVNSFAVMGTTLFAGTYGTGIYRSKDGGNSWTTVNTGLTNPWVNSLVVMNTTLFAAGGSGVYRSKDGGDSWTGVGLGGIYSLSVMGTTLFAGAYGTGGVFRSEDGGNAWVKTGLTNVVNSLAVMGTTLFAGTRDGVYRSDDRGNRWTAVNTGLKTLHVDSLAVVDTTFFAGTNDGLFRSEDKGSTWANTELKETVINVTRFVINPFLVSLAAMDTTLFAGTRGVYRSKDGGKTWNDISVGLARRDVRSLAVLGKKLYAGTRDGGVYRASLSDASSVGGGGTSVTGKVYYSTTPLNGVRVDLIQGSSPDDLSKPPIQTTTTSLGAYEFVRIQPGAYYIKVHNPYRDGWTAYPITVSNSPVTWDVYVHKNLNLISPANNSIVDSLKPLLTWESNPEAASYDVQMNVTSDWKLVEHPSGIVTTSFGVTSDLMPGTQYTWQVAAFNSQRKPVASSGEFRFTTPGSGAKASIIDTTPPTLTVSVNPAIANAKTGIVTITVASNEPLKLTGTDALNVTVIQAGAIPATVQMTSGVASNTYIGSYPIIAGKDGKATISATGADLAGNKILVPINVGFTVDTTPPDLMITTADNQVVSSSSFTINYSSKASDVSKYFISLNSATNFVDIGIFSSATVTLTTGENIIRVKAIDAAGNESEVKQLKVTLSVKPATTPPTLSIIAPTPNQVFPTGTTATTLAVKIENHLPAGHWHAHNKPFLTSGPAGGNIIVTSGNTTTITGLMDGQSYTIYVTLVDANHNVLNPPVTTSVTFSVAAPPLTFSPANTIQLTAGSATIPPGISVGSANGGIPPYVFTESIPDLAWLNVKSDGTITLAANQVVPTAGVYQLFVQVKDSVANTVSGFVNITVVVVEKAEFSISALNSTQSAEVGKSAVYIINLVSRGGFKSDLTLRIADAPKGVEAEFNPKVVSISAENPSNSSQLTIRVGNETPVGDHKFIVTAVALDKSIKELELQLQVKPLSLKNSFITIDVEPTQPRLGDKLKVKGEIIFEEGDVGARLAAPLPMTIIYTPPKGEAISQNLQTDESGKYIGELEAKPKGKWEITASWAGDKIFKAAKKSKTIEVLKGLSQIIWQPLQTEKPKVGDKIAIIAQLKPAIEAQTIKVQIIKPDGISTIESKTTQPNGALRTDVELTSEGIWKILASWDGNESYEKTTSQELQIIASTEAPKVIIVLGGGSERENPAWNKFSGLANHVYKILKNRKLTDDDIYYLSPSLKATAAIDRPTSESGLEYAITQWAKPRVGPHVPLFIYLLSHNLNDKFILEKRGDYEVMLTPEKLNGWLEVLPKEAEVMIIIEACYSGNFIKKKGAEKGEASVLSKPGRVIITSADSNRQAIIEGVSLLSFTRIFFDEISRNRDAKTAFLNTREALRASRSLQSPQLDANGDGIANDPSRDFPAVGSKYIPADIQLLPIVPEIVDVSKAQRLKLGEKASTIKVRLTGVDILKVIGTVIPPNYNPDREFKDWNDVDFETIKFEQKEEGLYEGRYDNFTQAGTYTIVMNAENPDGSSIPVETTVTVPAPATPWDVNSDGEVNIFDIVIVARNLGIATKEGDVNGDGKVDIFDIVIVASHFGEKLTGASPSFGFELSQLDYSQYLPLLEKAYQLLQSLYSSNPSPEFEMARKLLEHLIVLAKPVIKETKLLPNYPNPFNPETWIPYQLSESAEVTIRIYDMTGRLIRTLKLGRQSPGLYISKAKAAYWDGRNNSAEPVASGIYIYQFKAGKFSQFSKMVVIK